MADRVLCRGCNLVTVELAGSKCVKCSTRHLRDLPGNPNAETWRPLARKTCGYCAEAAPLVGMRWCGPCAIRENERGLGKSPERDAAIRANVAYFQKRMAQIVSVANTEPMPEHVDLSDLFQAFEDSKTEESKGAAAPDLVRGPKAPRPVSLSRKKPRRQKNGT